MKASTQWLAEISGIETSATEMAERLTRAGLEVEGTQRFGEGLDGVMVAEVRETKPHPKKDKLTLVRVFDGRQELERRLGIRVVWISIRYGHRIRFPDTCNYPPDPTELFRPRVRA